MQLGPFVIPMSLLMFVVSVAVMFLVGKLLEKQCGFIQTDLFLILLTGVIAARLAFVILFFSQFEQAMWKILDIRDLGFESLVGVAAAVAAAAWLMFHEQRKRVALTLALVSGIVAFTTARAFTDDRQTPQSLPVTDLASIDGASSPLSPNGQPTVINLWATWCRPCQAELPVFARAQAEMHDVRFIFVNQGEQRAAVKEYLTSRSIELKNVFLDPQITLAKQVHALGFPTTLFYDGRGNLLSVSLGPFSGANLNMEVERIYGIKR